LAVLALAVGPLALVVARTDLALKLAKQVQRVNGKVSLFGLKPNVREVFSITAFDRIFAIRDDRAGAIAAAE
jgi:anti-anti-sigma regulatory factor